MALYVFEIDSIAGLPLCAESGVLEDAARFADTFSETFSCSGLCLCGRSFMGMNNAIGVRFAVTGTEMDIAATGEGAGNGGYGVDKRCFGHGLFDYFSI